MLKSLLTKFVGDPNVKEMRRLQPLVEEISALEPQMRGRSAEGLRELTASFRVRVAEATAETRERLEAVREERLRTLDVDERNRLDLEIEGLERLVFNVRDPLKRSWPHSIDHAMAKSVLTM